ncbi:glycoside hydrolase family 18 protein [Sporosarcina beigongshangi]|uniref:hypothetical protein n=1 Tax=Sporosarcina beigongshangi TaxID=2782538 RepID=UPI0019395803|nr:hypothetical protein [Sporosarcina beigongshangi]
MDNKIKQELNKLDIPQNLHERLQQGVKQAKAEQPKRKYKNPLIATAAILVISFGMLLTPVGQATFNGLFEVTKFEKRPHNEELSFGYSWKGTAGYDTVTYDSLAEVENAYTIHIPFPEQLVTIEENTEPTTYSVAIDEMGNFLSYNYHLSTTERMYEVFATNVVESSPTFGAETTDGAAIEKEVFINGTVATLLGTNDLDGYSIYIKNEQWQMVITSFARGIHEEGVLHVTEDELIKIAESIQW